jgi:hypothetical protein
MYATAATTSSSFRPSSFVLFYETDGGKVRLGIAPHLHKERFLVAGGAHSRRIETLDDFQKLAEAGQIL